MAARTTAPLKAPVEGDRTASERVFTTDPDLLRAENARLQRDLKRALEERNRLLKKSGASSSGQARGSGLRVLEERLERTRIEFDRAKQNNKVLDERTRALEQRLTETGRIPGVFIANLEELVVSSGGVCPVLGTAVENAADAPERVVDRFDVARDALRQLFNHNRAMHDQSALDEINDLKVTLAYQKSEATALREERDRLFEQSEELEQSLQCSRSEVALRDEKLAEMQNRIGGIESEAGKRKENCLRLKSQVKSLQGVVDPAVFSFATATPAMSNQGGLSMLFSWKTLIGVVTGIILAVAFVQVGPGLVLAPAPAKVFHPIRIEGSGGVGRSRESSVLSKHEVREETEKSPSPTRFGNHRDPLVAGGFGPELIGLRSGNFSIGTDRYAAPNIEKPARKVSVRSFYISRFEVTFDQYDAFARATGRELPSDAGWGRGDRPVIDVSWGDATSYASWLSGRTGRTYRLPSEAEWEYAMGGGSGEPYWWGSSFEQGREICFNCGTLWSGRSTAPVGSAQANPQGLFDMGGNVMEWVRDCLTKQGTDASVGCEEQVVRGGAFNKPNDTLRITARRALPAETRRPMLGFRLVREVDG